jgi:ribonucleoside-triphosphate reductase
MQTAIKTFEKIRRRNGQIVPFDTEKITEAIHRAGEATQEFNGNVSKSLTVQVVTTALQMYGGKIPGVEQIQDITENVLINSHFTKTAKAYILYRAQHAEMREISAKFNVGLVEQYLKKSDWQVHENSNMDFSLQGLNNYISGEISKMYWLDKVYPANIKQYH